MSSDPVITRHKKGTHKPLVSALVYHLALVSCLLFFPAQAQSQATPAPAVAFIMGFDEHPTIFGSAWSLRIYAEAFRRLGIRWEPGFYPLARRTALMDAGTIDGDAARVQGYGSAHPNLVRVEESVMDFGFALYTASPTLKLQRLEDLPNSPYLAEYRRGILLCERKLKELVVPKNLSDITSEAQGLKKLLAGRTDLYCELDTVVQQALSSPEFKGVANIRKVIGIGSLPTYPYLHKKHAALAPRLAAVLRQMKAEGLIETYRIQAERDLGWKQ